MSGSPSNAFQKFGCARYSERDAGQRSFVASFSRLGDFYKNDVFTDVTLVVGQSTFKAHKIILCCHSPVFEAMFTTGMLEATQSQVVINDIKPRTFNLLLDYLYTGATLNLDPDDAIDLFVAADKYGIASLSTACEKLLIDKVTSKNVIGMYLMAENFKRAALKKRAYTFMRLYMEDIVKTEGWLLIADNADILRRIVTANSHRAVQLNALMYSFKRNSAVHRPLNSFSPWCSYSWKLEDSLRPNQFIFPDRIVNHKVYIVLDLWEKDGSKILSANAFIETRIHEAFKLYVKSYFCQENEDKDKEMKSNFQEGIFLWIPGSAHPTLGNRRVEVHRSEIPKDFDIFKCELILADEAFEKTLAQDSTNPRVVPIKTIEAWSFQSDATIAIARATQVLDSARGQIENSSKVPLPIIIFKSSGLYPSRDQVNLHLLKAARRFDLSPLILYLEHALVWDLDPYNTLERIEAGLELGLGFLKWGALQYFKMKSERIIKTDAKNWKQLKPAMLKEILLETNRNMFPFFLPSFLVEVK